MFAARTTWPLEVILIVAEALQSLASCRRLEALTVAVLLVAIIAFEILSFLAEDVKVVQDRIPQALRQVRECCARVNEAVLGYQ